MWVGVSTRFSLEKPIRLSRLLSVICQSRVAPQKPSSDLLRLKLLPRLSVFSGLTSRPSYMAKKNNRSLINGPEPQKFKRVESVLSRQNGRTTVREKGGWYV